MPENEDALLAQIAKRKARAEQRQQPQRNDSNSDLSNRNEERAAKAKEKRAASEAANAAKDEQRVQDRLASDAIQQAKERFLKMQLSTFKYPLPEHKDVTDMKLDFVDKVRNMASNSYDQQIQFVSKYANGRIGRHEIAEWGNQVLNALADYDRLYDVVRTWDAETLSAVKNHNVVVGMTTAQAILAWGSPQKKNLTVVGGQQTEQWVYSLTRYLYIRDGKVEAAQVSH